METEQHPLEPFLPANARLLMLGSFPPQRKRWSMEFYYPNWNNDMWRIVGLIFFGDREHFVVRGEKAFYKERLVAFLQEKGIALFDTATAVRRLQDNASDKFLEVVQPTDIRAMLDKLPQCRAIVTTGEKATETLCAQFALAAPKVGDFTEFVTDGRHRVRDRRPSAAPLSDALLFACLSPGFGEESGRLSRHVSGLADALSNFLARYACIFKTFHYLCSRKHGNSSVGRASVSKTECREFEPLFPCNKKIRYPSKDIGFFCCKDKNYFKTTSTLRAPWAPITSACSMSAVFEGPEMNTP